MTASLSPVGPSVMSSRGAPMADAAVVEAMREPHFRIGWLERTLLEAAGSLHESLTAIRTSDTRTRSAITHRIEEIERTLRLGKEADYAVWGRPEKAPTAPEGIAA